MRAKDNNRSEIVLDVRLSVTPDDYMIGHCHLSLNVDRTGKFVNRVPRTMLAVVYSMHMIAQSLHLKKRSPKQIRQRLF